VSVGLNAAEGRVQSEHSEHEARLSWTTHRLLKPSHQQAATLTVASGRIAAAPLQITTSIYIMGKPGQWASQTLSRAY